MSIAPADDRDLLSRLGHADAPLLGEGGEARVYAADDAQVIRILRPGADALLAEERRAWAQEISTGSGDLPFATPLVERLEIIGDRVVSFEKRLPGQPLSTVLSDADGPVRAKLVEAYLETALRIGDIEISRDWYGPMLGNVSQRRDSFADVMRLRLEEVAERCPDDLRAAVLREAAREWDEPDRPRLVHLDYFPANVLVLGEEITAVLDFGPSTIIGDRRLDAWGAVAYLDAEISPHANDADRAQAIAWLERHDLATGYEQAKRWIAASWTHASDDAGVMAWCRRVLLD